MFKSKPSKSPWWDDTCTDLIKKRKQAENSFLKNPSQENLKILTQIETHTKNQLRKIKKQKFKNYVEKNLSKDTELKTIWKTISCFKNITNYKPPYSSNDLEIIGHAQTFISEYCPPSDHTIATQDPQQNITNEENPNKDLDSPFIMIELNLAIDSANITSSPGLDQVDYKMLNFTPQNFKKILLNTINHYYQNNKSHESWKKFLITLILRIQKANSDPSP